MTTTSFGTSVNQGVTRTTATEVKSTCATITGCNFPDADATTTIPGCELPARRTAAPAAEVTGTVEKRAPQEPDWACDSRSRDFIFIPQNPENNAQQAIIRQYLNNRNAALGITNGYEEIRAHALSFTAFYYVRNLGNRAVKWFATEVPEVCPIGCGVV